MATEKDKRLEASVIVLPALRRGLKGFEDRISFREVSDDSPVNFQEKEDFRTLTSLALTAQKLNAQPQEWRQRVEDRRQALKTEMAEVGDVITSIEIDEAYCDFLMTLGETDKAVELAQHITEGYVLPAKDTLDDNPFAFMAKGMQEIQFSKKKDHALVDLAYKFIKKGDLAKAAELVEGVNLSQEGYLYFAGLLDYHKEKGDVIAIQQFISDMDNRTAIAEADKDDFVGAWRFLRGLSNQAKEAIAEIQTQNGDLSNAMENMADINVGNHRVMEQIKFVGRLLEEGKEDEARQLAGAIIKDINTNTSDLPDKEFHDNEDDEEEDEKIGSLDFAKPIEAEPEVEEEEDKHEFRNYDRAENLSSLAKTLAKYPQYKDLFDTCIRCTEESIVLTYKDSQSSLWSNLIEAFGEAGDQGRLEEYYQRGCELYPKSKDFLTEQYAYALYEFDQQKALELILSNPDLERRADGFASFIKAQIEEKGFGNWEELVAQLVTLEDAVLLPHNSETDFSINDLSEVVDGDEEDPDQQVVTSASTGGFSFFVSSEWPPKSKFWRKSPGLLANLSKLAITKGEWDIFGKIFQDERMSPTLKVHVLSEVSDWLQDGKEIKFWF